jgi:hypothetical protein
MPTKGCKVDMHEFAEQFKPGNCWGLTPNLDSVHWGWMCELTVTWFPYRMDEKYKFSLDHALQVVPSLTRSTDPISPVQLAFANNVNSVPGQEPNDHLSLMPQTRIN